MNRGKSTFIEMGPSARAVILLYIVSYHIIFPVARILSIGGNEDLLGVRIVAESVFYLLLVYPIIFHKNEYGWLHPLVLPSLFFLGKTLAKNPLALIFPFDYPIIDYTVATTSTAAVLVMPSAELAQARLGEALIRCLSAATVLLAFKWGPRIRVPRVRVFQGTRAVPAAALAFIGILLAISLFFVASQGGFSDLLVAMRGGRRNLFQEQGQFLFAASASTTITLIWFMYEKRPSRNLVFIAAFVAAGLIGILVTGSRSSLILPAASLVLLAWKRKGRPLIAPTIMVVVFGLLVVGVFGSIRQDFGSTTVDLSVLNPMRYTEMMSRAVGEVESRDDEEPSLAAFQGTQEKGLLWGKSYVGALAFWIPRAIWREKPRTVDTYNMWVNFVGNPIDRPLPEFGTYGIPVRADLEAYWNFHLIGVVVIFFLIGTFYRFATDAAVLYDKVPFFWVVYLMFVVTFDGSSKSLVEVLRLGVLTVLFLFSARILRLGRVAVSGPPVGGAAALTARRPLPPLPY